MRPLPEAKSKPKTAGKDFIFLVWVVAVSGISLGSKTVEFAKMDRLLMVQESGPNSFIGPVAFW